MSHPSERGIPENAVVAILLVSLIIPFVGRVAIGWIVDVTTIGATLVYGFLCAAVFRAARTNGDRIDAGVGFVGTVVMVMLAALVLLPNLTDASALASETYILIIAWCILGFIVFRFILRNDRDRRYGRSSVVWTVFLGVALFMAMAWMGEVNQAATDKVIVDIQAYYDGTAGSPDYIFDKGAFITSELRAMHDAQRDNTLMVALLFAIALIVMMVNYSFVRKREEESERRLGVVRDVAYRDPLTGVKSKHAFVEAEMAMDERISSGEDVAFSVVVCDINELKSMNDTKGHSAGDELIRSACALVCTTFKHSPVFRIGGDEFLALLEGSDYEWRDALIARLNDTVEENLANSGVVVSVGIADFISGTDKKVRSVTDRADALMYERKRELKKMALARRA